MLFRLASDPRRRAWRTLLFFLLTGALFAGARPAYAAAITVNGTTCTLANAITAANNDTATNGCITPSPCHPCSLRCNRKVNRCVWLILQAKPHFCLSKNYVRIKKV